jgi:hypothetical protein
MSSIITIPIQQLQFKGLELPMLSARAFGVRIGLDDFDQRAPSVVFHDPWSWKILQFDELFRANNIDENGKAFAVILDNHPITHVPFLCLRGIREYHEHPQHSGDDWMLYRTQVGLFDILLLIWRTCINLTRPNVIISPNQIQVLWEPIKPQ